MTWKADIQYIGTLWNKPNMTAEVRAAVKETGAFARKILPTNTPVDTGKMAASWKVGTGERTLVISNGVPYAGFVEYGTRKMRAREPLGKSLPEIEEFFQDTLLSKIEAKLEGAGSGRRAANLGSLARQVAGLRGLVGSKMTRPTRN